jgi:predicted membrane GTPase involved in stress response
MKRAGAGSAELPAAGAGDIVSISGIAGVGIADTICSPAVEEGLPPGHIEPPTLRWFPARLLVPPVPPLLQCDNQ